MGEKSKKRRGGARDETDIYVGYSRKELFEYILRIEAKTGVHYRHDFDYTFKRLSVPRSVLPIFWRKVKKTIRKHIDGWQQELPLF